MAPKPALAPAPEESAKEAAAERLIRSDAPAGPKIHAAIAAIMSEVGGVGKTRRNEQQKYNFRGIADIYLACQPLMAKHGVHLTPHAVLDETTMERKTASGGLMLHRCQRIEFRFYHSDGSYFSCVTTGEAMDTGDKAANKVMSAAAKYALITTFAIPEEDPDVDTENSSPAPRAEAAAPAPASRAPARGAAAPTTAAMTITKLACGAVPEGLGWAKPHAVSWLKKYFGVETTSALTPQQSSDAEALLVARKGSEQAYRTKLEMFHSEGRVLGAPEGEGP